MTNPLLAFLQRLRDDREQTHRVQPVEPALTEPSELAQTGTFFLVMRRMRAPLIVLILIFSVSVLGLTLIPGQDVDGRPWRMSFFDAFYFMSYTATTIGFGEIPYPFTIAQRMWVTVSIFLGVVGWAYAIGTLLALLQDRDLRQAVSITRFARRVAHLAEPFVLVAGYGQAGRAVAQALDATGRRLVVLDVRKARINGLDLDALRSDVPGLAADASVPATLVRAGLESPRCEAVLALTDDDRANLAIVQAASLLRPGIQVVARAGSAAAAHRMAAFGSPAVVNPFDAFGDHLRTAMRVPAAYQLAQWLTGPPGSRLPPRPRPPRGPWVVLDGGQFGQELQRDLRADGLHVTLLDPRADPDDLADDLADAEDMLWTSVGFVAGSDDDARNLSALQQVRRTNPGLFLIARQNRPDNARLYEAIGADLLLVAADVTAHEVIAHLGSPLLRTFLLEATRQSEEWAEDLVRELTGRLGAKVPLVWELALTADQAPTLTDWLQQPGARLGDLMRSPSGRRGRVDAVVLLLAHHGLTTVTPRESTWLERGDRLLLAGTPGGRHQLETTVTDPATQQYVIHGRNVPTTWLGRALRRSR